MIEDQELRLVPPRSEEVRAESCAATDHLPELRWRLHRFGEDQVHDLRNVDARGTSMSIEIAIVSSESLILEVVDELLGAGVVCR